MIRLEIDTQHSEITIDADDDGLADLRDVVADVMRHHWESKLFISDPGLTLTLRHTDHEEAS
jgi:hypothetical protein